MFAFIPGLSGQEFLLLGVLCVLPMIAGAVVLVVVLANQNKKKKKKHATTMTSDSAMSLARTAGRVAVRTC